MLKDEEVEDDETTTTTKRKKISSMEDYKMEGKIFRYSKLIPTPIFRNVESSKPNYESFSQLSSLLCTDTGKQLLICAKDGHFNKVYELMSNGASFVTDWLGMSALHFAAANNHYKLCDLLLRGGISRDGRTKVDRTPLHFAVYEGNENIVRLLIERRCEINPRDMLRMTPLHWAIEKGFISIAKLLIKHGADVTALSKFNKTPISLAVEHGHLELFDELNSAKESQLMEKLYLDAINESETNDAVNSISTKSDKPVEYRIESDKEDIPVPVPESDRPSSVDDVKAHSSRSPRSPDDDSENNSKNDDEEEEIKYIEPIHLENMSDESQDGRSSVMELLKSHGISMLPHDDDPATSLISSALKSGRKFVLSEAGKLVLNETKLKQSHQEQIINKEATDNNKTKDLSLVHRNEKDLSVSDEEKNNDNKRRLSTTSKNKKRNNSENSTHTTKKVKIITMQTYKKICEEEMINSIKKSTKPNKNEDAKHFVTNTTRINRTSQNPDAKPIKILNKEAPEKMVSKQTIHATIELDDGDLPPNIEMCVDSDTDYGDSINHHLISGLHHKSDSEIVSDNETIIEDYQEPLEMDDIKSFPSTVSQLRLSHKSSTIGGSSYNSNHNNNNNNSTNNIIYNTSNKVDTRTVLIRNSNEHQVTLTPIPANIKKEAQITHLLNIPEICQELYELKKEVEVLKKCKEEYRLRIEKLERERFN